MSLKLSPAAQTPAARDHDPRRGQVGPLGTADLLADEARERGIRRRGHGLNLGATALRLRGVEERGAHGDHLDRIARSHRRHGVAGVDRADECVRRDNARDVRYLGHVQERGEPRHHVLGRGRRWSPRPRWYPGRAPTISANSAAVGSASRCAYAASSHTSTPPIPSICAAASATTAQPEPTTTIRTASSIARAALTAFSVAGRSAASS